MLVNRFWERQECATFLASLFVELTCKLSQESLPSESRSTFAKTSEAGKTICKIVVENLSNEVDHKIRERFVSGKVDPTARSRAIDPKILSESCSEVKRSTTKKAKRMRARR
jgi:hypothetical protein